MNFVCVLSTSLSLGLTLLFCSLYKVLFGQVKAMRLIGRSNNVAKRNILDHGGCFIVFVIDLMSFVSNHSPVNSFRIRWDIAALSLVEWSKIQKRDQNEAINSKQ